jgi:hypothetical protein
MDAVAQELALLQTLASGNPVVVNVPFFFALRKAILK